MFYRVYMVFNVGAVVVQNVHAYIFIFMFFSFPSLYCPSIVAVGVDRFFCCWLPVIYFRWSSLFILAVCPIVYTTLFSFSTQYSAIFCSELIRTFIFLAIYYILNAQYRPLLHYCRAP